MFTDAVLATLDEYARTYCAKDIDGLMAVFDDEDHISVIGTGADEFCIGRGQVKELFLRNFSEATANRFEWHRKHLYITQDHAVVALKLTIHLELEGARVKLPLRWTVVLRYRNGRWVWLHRNASTAASGQSEGQAYPKTEKSST